MLRIKPPTAFALGVFVCSRYFILFSSYEYEAVYKPERMLATAQDKLGEKGRLTGGLSKKFIRKNPKQLKPLIIAAK